MAKWLYIPIEVKVREFHAKLLLAKHAAANGYTVVLGRKAEIMQAAKYLPPGIFFAMWVQINFKNYFKALKKRGFSITGLDEEGLVTFDDDMYARFKISEEALNYVDRFFAWGQYQANIVQPFVHTKTSVDIVGNLRFDPLRRELRSMLKNQTRDLRKKYRKYVLIVSSFGLNNHVLGPDLYMKALRKSLTIRSDDEEHFLRRYMLLQRAVFEDLLQSIPRLALEYPDHSFIIRPHPGEDMTCWLSCKNSASNVFIESDGNIHNWILGADCIIHHFCTTALEAYAADIPAIAYRPAMDNDLESNVPYAVSLEATNSTDLIEKVGDLIAGRTLELEIKRDEAKSFIKRYIQNIDGPFCYEAVLTALDSLSVISTYDNFYVLTYRIKSLLLDALKDVKRLIFRGKKNYIDHKFSDLTAHEIQDVFATIPGHAQMNVKKLSSMCFIVQKE